MPTTRSRRAQLTTLALILVAATLVLVAGAKIVLSARASGRALAAAALGEAYPLDSRSRLVLPAGPLACPRVDLARYSGSELPFHKPALVERAFLPRLKRLEQVIAEEAVAVYGRPPLRLLHMGVYNCRRIRTAPAVLSEHAFANAIDLSAFDFGPLPRRRRKAAPADAPRGPFRVSLLRHWDGPPIHSRFLRRLDRRFRSEPGLFTVVLGPEAAGHRDHWHLDRSPRSVSHLLALARHGLGGRVQRWLERKLGRRRARKLARSMRRRTRHMRRELRRSFSLGFDQIGR